jgi:ABC-type antimicrobial peptide transport system, ATPase component
MSLLQLEKVSYCYDPLKEVRVISDISYEFEKGKIYAIVGKSGSGKTTLLSLLSGLATPTDGRILFNGKDIAEINQYKYRSQMVGVIFQSYNLLLQYNAVDNVVLSLNISGKHFENKKNIAIDTLAKVELTGDKIYRKILKLSGGEQQRVAIARALSFEPEVILADEPTGNLDIGTQDEILSIFKKLAYEQNKCIIIVTHSPEVAACADEVYKLAEYVDKKKVV